MKAFDSLHRRLQRALVRIGFAVMGVAALWVPGAQCIAADTAVPNAELKDASIAICEDDNEWPPYSYFKRQDGQKTDKIVGFAVDVVDEIFARHHIHYTISLIPWARCLAELKNGTSYQMALNPSYSEERAKTYLLTRAYYSTSNYYFYSLKNNPAGLPIGGMADLKRYTVCGIHGYNYATYGFRAGEMDQGARDFRSLIGKLHAGRCTLFLEKYEVMAGYSVIGSPYLDDPNLGRTAVPGMAPTPFHLGISRGFAKAEALKGLLDQEVTHMEASGRLQALWKKAVPN